MGKDLAGITGAFIMYVLAGFIFRFIKSLIKKTKNKED